MPSVAHPVALQNQCFMCTAAGVQARLVTPVFNSTAQTSTVVGVKAGEGSALRGQEGGKLVFEALGAPNEADVLDVARSAERIDSLLRESGRSLEPQGDEPAPDLVLDQPGLAACYAAAARGVGVSGERAGLPVLRLVFGTQPGAERAEPGSGEPIAEHRGVNVHAKQCVDGGDRRWRGGRPRTRFLGPTREPGPTSSASSSPSSSERRRHSVPHENDPSFQSEGRSPSRLEPRRMMSPGKGALKPQYSRVMQPASQSPWPWTKRYS